MITSLPFWFILVGTVVVYWRLKQARPWFLTGVSVVYLATIDWQSVLALSLLSLLAFDGKARERKEKSRALSNVLIGVVLAYLAYCKYIPHLANLLTSGPTVADAAVPLGASYFAFKLIHYLVENARKTLPPHGLSEFLSYMFFFPMYPAGPIERFDAFLANRADSFSREMLIQGGTRIAYGLIKKLVVCDVLLERHVLSDGTHLWEAIPFIYPAAPPEHLLENLAMLHPLFVWQFVTTWFADVYFDFSAYSDVAIGAGMLFGVKLGENFDHPLLAPNISEFWKRWHMSLSNWCQRYIYLPTMARLRRPYVALFATMAVMGIWHGGDLSFLLWGLYHGTLLALYVTWGRIKRRKKWKMTHPVWAVMGCLSTFLLVSASMAFTATRPFGFFSGLRVFAALFGVRV